MKKNNFFDDCNFEVFQFCKQHNIECSWDLNRRDSVAWTDILLDGKLVMQVQSNATVESFKACMKLMVEDFDREDFPIGGEDFFINADDEKIFLKFIERYKDILL